jgi:hypothetical protein
LIGEPAPGGPERTPGSLWAKHGKAMKQMSEMTMHLSCWFVAENIPVLLTCRAVRAAPGGA